MDTHELINEWPSWRNAGAAAIIASPAFAMPMEVNGEELLLKSSQEPLSDTLELDLRLEESPCRLSLADSTAFPDLHKLWPRRDALPKTLLLALVESECGGLLQSLENAVRLQLSIAGIAHPSAPSGHQYAFQLGDIRFALELPQAAVAAIGRLDFLDTGHPSIRQMQRDVWTDYTSFILTRDEIAGLSPGDVLLLDDDFLARADWAVQPPADDALHLRSIAATSVSFGDFADETLPPIHAPTETLQLVRRSQFIAEGELSTIGERKCFKLIRLHS